jgi:hypothetical protein
VFLNTTNDDEGTASVILYNNNNNNNNETLTFDNIDIFSSSDSCRYKRKAGEYKRERSPVEILCEMVHGWELY